jgi:hypothetical protein
VRSDLLRDRRGKYQCENSEPPEPGGSPSRESAPQRAVRGQSQLILPFRVVYFKSFSFSCISASNSWVFRACWSPVYERMPKLLWVRRTALLALHDPLLAGEGDFDHFARLAASLLHEREFFIRKAVGLVLRSAARRRPDRTIAFTERYAREMSALTFKEATRLLPAAAQKRLRKLGQ